jgi:hypothetical protein
MINEGIIEYDEAAYDAIKQKYDVFMSFMPLYVYFSNNEDKVRMEAERIDPEMEDAHHESVLEFLTETFREVKDPELRELLEVTNAYYGEWPEIASFEEDPELFHEILPIDEASEGDFLWVTNVHSEGKNLSGEPLGRVNILFSTATFTLGHKGGFLGFAQKNTIGLCVNLKEGHDKMAIGQDHPLEVLKHELTHLTQGESDRPEAHFNYGFPSKKSGRKDYDYQEDEEDPDNKLLPRFTHAAMGVEFYTRLGDSIRAVKRMTSGMSQGQVNQTIRTFIDDARFFQVLKKQKPGWYRKAVKLMTSEVNKGLAKNSLNEGIIEYDEAAYADVQAKYNLFSKFLNVYRYFENSKETVTNTADRMFPGQGLKHESATFILKRLQSNIEGINEPTLRKRMQSIAGLQWPYIVSYEEEPGYFEQLKVTGAKVGDYMMVDEAKTRDIKTVSGEPYGKNIKLILSTEKFTLGGKAGAIGFYSPNGTLGIWVKEDLHDRNDQMETIKHELTHMAQTPNKQDVFNYGYPSKKSSRKDYDYDASGRNINRFDHATRGVEFYPRLSDEIRYAAKRMVGTPEGELNGKLMAHMADTDFFIKLKAEKPGWYKKAVKLFTAEVPKRIALGAAALAEGFEKPEEGHYFNLTGFIADYEDAVEGGPKAYRDFFAHLLRENPKAILGCGSFRCVASFDNDYIVKFASDKLVLGPNYDYSQGFSRWFMSALKINKTESELMNQDNSGIYPKIFKTSPKGLWQIQEKVEIINSKDQFMDFFPKFTNLITEIRKKFFKQYIAKDDAYVFLRYFFHMLDLHSVQELIQNHDIYKMIDSRKEKFDLMIATGAKTDKEIDEALSKINRMFFDTYMKDADMAFQNIYRTFKTSKVRNEMWDIRVGNAGIANGRFVVADPGFELDKVFAQGKAAPAKSSDKATTRPDSEPDSNQHDAETRAVSENIEQDIDIYEDKEIVIDFRQINESWFTMFGSWVEYALKRMMIGLNPKLSVRGNESQVQSFAKALASEKKYMDSFISFGLEDPKTYRSKAYLDKAIGQFERKTGLKWPYK